MGQGQEGTKAMSRSEDIDQLEQRIATTETARAKLKAELAAERQRDQHEAVDNLEVYLNEARVSLGDIGTFIDAVLEDLRRLARKAGP